MSYTAFDNVTQTWLQVDAGIDKYDSPLYDGDIVYDSYDLKGFRGMYLYTVQWVSSEKCAIKFYKVLITGGNRPEGLNGHQHHGSLVKVPKEIADKEVETILFYLSLQGEPILPTPKLTDAGGGNE